MSACSADDKVIEEALPSPSSSSSSPTESPSPTPPPLEPVAGTVELVTEDASWNDQLGLDEDGAPSEGAVEAAVTAVTAALDRFLDAAQAGQPTLKPLRGLWLANVDPEAAEVLQTGLTNGDNPVAAAQYVLFVQLEPNPTLVTADVRVDRRDGTRVTVELVFDVTGDQPRLQLAGGMEAVS